MKTITTLEQIADQFAGQKTVVMHSGFAEPMMLARQLFDHAGLWPGLTIHTLMPPGPCPYSKEPSFTLQTLLPHEGLRHAVNTGRASLFRESLFYHANGHLKGDRAADVLLLQVSPPDKAGRVSLGLSVSYMPHVMASRPVVVAQINSAVPKTGYSITSSEIDYALYHDEALPFAAPTTPNEIDRRVARNVISLLGDAITLEIGIGSIPEVVLLQSSGLKNLSVHTGLINDSIVPLVDAGNLSGPVVTTMAMGSTKFYNWLDQNNALDFRPVAETHDPDLIACIPRFHAVNGALQVDLCGAVNSERIGSRIISNLGGLPDFAAGACRSSGGKSIIALRSTAGRIPTSTIVGKADCQTLDGSLVDYIVTEYGIAPVRSLDPPQRAAAIRAIAHPDFRDQL